MSIRAKLIRAYNQLGEIEICKQCVTQFPVIAVRYNFREERGAKRVTHRSANLSGKTKIDS